MRTNGPAKKICQQSAIGKLSAVVWIQFGIRDAFTPLKSAVATKLIIGHITQTVIAEIARITKISLSSPGVTKRNASFFASGPARCFSSHSAHVHGNIVYHHRVYHHKYHHNRKNNILKFCLWHFFLLFWHKK